MLKVITMEDSYHIELKEEEKLEKMKSQRRRGRSINRGKELPMPRHIIPKVRLKNHMVTQKEEEVPKGDGVVEEIIFLEKEEEAKQEK
jgi:hypothetical protein